MTPVNQLPSEITAGDSIDFAMAPALYPARDGWHLEASFAGPQTLQSWVSESDTALNHHVFSVAAADTADYTAGTYWSQLVAVNGDKRVTIARSQLTVLPSLANVAEPFDGRSAVKKALDAVQARIWGKATQDQLSMTVAGRSISRIPLSELMALELDLRTKYRLELDREAIKNGTYGGPVTYTRLGK